MSKPILLIVDDHAEFLAALRRPLRAHYDVRVARSAAEAHAQLSPRRTSPSWTCA